ncbi:MAG TPA: hypothetical protein PKV21_01805 [bacterium]|nr:hypothetical protein [bacterium]HOM26225.1 hypothetical protein [bacterium]
MKKLILVVFAFSVLTGFSEIKKATYEEIKNSIQILENAMKEEKEDLIPIFSEAIEIEKRATSPYYAEKIMEKICKTGKIKEEEFKNLRKNFSFFDISLAWAINQITGKPVEKILKEKEENGWINIISSETTIQREDISSKIKELNPKSETF